MRRIKEIGWEDALRRLQGVLGQRVQVAVGALYPDEGWQPCAAFSGVLYFGVPGDAFNERSLLHHERDEELSFWLGEAEVTSPPGGFVLRRRHFKWATWDEDTHLLVCTVDPLVVMVGPSTAGA